MWFKADGSSGGSEEGSDGRVEGTPQHIGCSAGLPDGLDKERERKRGVQEFRRLVPKQLER